MESHVPLSLLTHTVNATTAAKSGAGSFAPILILAALAAVFYFLMIRPQRKKQQAARQKASEAAVGDKVLLAGGFIAHIIAVRDSEVDVRLSADSTATVDKRGVLQVITEPQIPLDDRIGNDTPDSGSNDSDESQS